MSKVPCGGFKLDNNFLGMNENDELSLTGGGEGKAYQYLVTDGTSTAKWEARLAYDDSRVVVDFPEKGVQFVKVSDEVPSWASVDVPMKYWLSNGEKGTLSPEHYVSIDNEGFLADGMALIMADNVEFNGHVFPEKGVYFLLGDSFYVSGIASADSDTPEIIWDGNIETIKTIDPKYIPSELNEVILPSSTSGSSKKFKITVDDSGTISATEITT